MAAQEDSAVCVKWKSFVCVFKDALWTAGSSPEDKPNAGIRPKGLLVQQLIAKRGLPGALNGQRFLKPLLQPVAAARSALDLARGEICW